VLRTAEKHRNHYESKIILRHHDEELTRPCFWDKLNSSFK
jgi:hypothetical protein